MFTDSQGRKFEAVITLPTVVELKNAGIDLGLQMIDLMDVLAADPVKLGDALWIVHREAATVHGVTDESFGRLLDGDTLAAAVDSLQDAIVLFSRPAQRLALRKLVAKSRDIEAAAAAKMLEAVESIDPIAALSTLSESAGNSLASPG